MKQNNQQRPTPETDALAVICYGEGGIESSYGFRAVPIENCRQLERERDELAAKLVANEAYQAGLLAERDKAREQIQMMLKHGAERLESDSIVGSCDCLTKTPEVKYHKPGCKYRILTERTEAVTKLLTHMSEHSSNWNREEDLPIQTGYSESIEGDAYYAAAMKSYKPVKP